MGDIFDKVVADESTGDIFDQVAQKKPDIFDQVATKKEPDVFDQLAQAQERPEPSFSAPPEDYKQHEIVEPPPTPKRSGFDLAGDAVIPVPANIAAQTMQSVSGAARLLGFDEWGAEKSAEARAVLQQINTEHPIGTDNWWEALRGALTSIGVQLPALATGNIPLALSVMGAQTGLAGADQALDEGASKPVALAAGAVKGVSEALTELLPVGYVMKFAGPLKKRLIGLLASEIPGETLNTVVDWAVDNAVAKNTGKETLGLEDLATDISRTLKAVAIQTPMMAGGAHMLQQGRVRDAIRDASVEAKKETGKVAAEHLEQFGLKDTIVFSAERTNLEKDLNDENTKEVERLLTKEGIPYRKVQGMYEGSTENSFVIPSLPGSGALVRKLAQRFDQDSILLVDGKGAPMLITQDGAIEKLPGIVREITKEEADQAVGYTHDPETGKYFSNMEEQAVQEAPVQEAQEEPAVVEAPVEEVPTEEIIEEKQGLDKVLDEVSDTEAGMEGDPAGMVGFNIKDTKPPITGLESVNPEVEARMVASEGLPGTKLVDRLKAKGQALAAETKHFRWLDYKKDGAVVDTLRLQEAVPAMVKAQTADIQQWITEGLDKTRLRVFSRYLVMADMLKDVKLGALNDSNLPFGYNSVEQVSQDYAKYQQLAANNPEIQEAVDKRQRFMTSLRSELVGRKLLNEESLKDDRYFHHQVLSHMADKTTGTYAGDVRTHQKGWQKKRNGKAYEYNTEYITAEYEVISQALSQIETQKSLEKIDEQTNIADQLREEAKERGVENWKTLIPEGFTTWQPTPGNHFFPASTVTEQVLGEVLSGERQLNLDDIAKVMAVGQKRTEWVIPQRLAKTLDEFRDFKEEGNVSQTLRALNTTWKQWTLLNPYRVIKYNLNNMSGDLDIALAYNPAILKKFKPAMKEVWKYKKGKTAQGDVREALRYAVIDSGMTVHEIADITKQGFYKALMGERPSAVSAYWDNVKSFTNFRENILRLAAYKHFKQEIAAGKSVYGASNPWEVDAITDPKQRAAKLARELVGDYGNLSHAGQWVRKNLIPFYSWMEINAPRYVRIMRNIKHEGGGSQARVGAVAGWGMAKKAGSLALKTSLLFNMANLWNLLAGQLLGIDGDERERITKNRNQLHVILGRGKDGKILTIKFQGALQDALNWFALDTPWEDAQRLFNGKLDAKEKMVEMVKAPFEKVIHGMAPIPKTGMEILTGKSLYPNPWPGQQRPIRDPWEHAARMWSVDVPYRYLAGKPTRGVARDVGALIGYSSDPNEQAYYDNYNTIWEFLKDQGRERPSGIPTKKANKLYYLRQAIKYGDEKAAKKYFKEYIELGGNPKGLKKSLKRLHPLAAIPQKLRGKYIAHLTPQELKTLEKALKWYAETYVIFKNFNR